MHRVRTRNEAVFQTEFEDLAVTRGLRTVLVPGPRDGTSWAPIGSPGNGGTALRHLVPDIAEREVFVCGPDAWMDAALTAAQQASVPVERLHAEHFAW